MTERPPPKPNRPPPLPEPCGTCGKDHEGPCWPIVFWTIESTLGLLVIAIVVWVLA